MKFNCVIMHNVKFNFVSSVSRMKLNVNRVMKKNLKFTFISSDQMEVNEMVAETLILHSDLNCYYASVEMNEHPELRGKKVAVCGSTENRHGIVLTASYPAKRSGVKTGMANWQAKQA